MSRKGESQSDPADLRRRAEELLRKKSDDLAAIPPEEAGRLLHDLQVRRIEMEMQIDELRRAQQELEASRVKYFNLYDMAPVAYFTVSEKELILEANLRAAELLGVDRDRLVEQRLPSYIAPEDQDSYYLHRKRLLETGARQVCELRMCGQNGSRFWGRLVTSAEPDSEDGPPVCRTTVSDITEQKRAEEALQQSEERYRLLFQNMSSGFALHEIILDDAGKPCDYRFIDVNPAFTNLTGLKAEGLVGRTVLEAMPGTEPYWIEAYGSVALTGDPIEFVHHSAVLGRHYEVIAYSPEHGRFATILHDVTERKQVEEDLRSSSDTLQALVNSSPLAIVTFDRDGSIGMWNPAAERMFGWRAEEVMGRPHPIVPEDRQEEFREFREIALGGGTFTGRELRRLRKDGSYIDISVSTAPLHDAAGSITSVMSIITDITGRKRSEEEKRNLERRVQQAQKLESLSVLAGGIAHDFNNVLMAVLGHAELALEEIPPMSPSRGNLTEITTAARRAADLCRQMLAYAGKAAFAVERVGLRGLVEKMAHLLKTAISKKAILNLNLERGLPPIEADPGQIRQIVLNLIINASEAIGDRSGVIAVSVGATRCDEEYLRKTELPDGLAPGLYVHLEVTDTGGGMDAETQSRTFEPFFSTKFNGRGLGLAAVLGIVRSHKGTIKVHSEPGKGTTFKILFPALTEREDATRSPDSSPVAGWRGKGTILLVDDEETLIALGARMLEHLGFSVLTAMDGRKAVDLYRERGKEIDLVLMDLTMPHMDGAEAFGELRRMNPEVPVVLASGYSSKEVASRFAGKGPDGVLQKPYTLAKLRESLAGLMPKRLDGEE